MANAGVFDVENGGLQVMSIEIRNVTPGYQNTEFVYKIMKLTQDVMFITKFVVEIDQTLVHHLDVLSCNDATPGTFM